MFHLTIRTPFEDIFAGEVSSVSFAGEGGDMQVFEDHASLTANILFSPVVITEAEGKENHFLGRQGIFSFDNTENKANLLLSYCEKKSEVNYQTVKEYAEFITKQLEEGKELSDFQLLYLKGEKLAVEEQISEFKE